MLVDCSPESIGRDACLGDHRQYVPVFWVLGSRIGFVGKPLDVHILYSNSRIRGIFFGWHGFTCQNQISKFHYQMATKAAETCGTSCASQAPTIAASCPFPSP